MSNEKNHLTPEWQKTFFHWWHKIALILLIGHGLLDLWESIYFMVVEYPELNYSLELHSVQTLEVSQLISRAIIRTVTTTIIFLFAVRLAKVKETTAHNIDLIVSTLLIISTKLIQNALVQLGLLNFIYSFLIK